MRVSEKKRLVREAIERVRREKLEGKKQVGGRPPMTKVIANREHEPPKTIITTPQPKRRAAIPKPPPIESISWR